MIAELIEHKILREYVKREVVTFAQARAGEMWAGDILAGEGTSAHRRMDRVPSRKRSPSSGYEMMSDTIRRGEKGKKHLGGLFQVAYAVCVEGKKASEYAAANNERPEVGTAFLRKALEILEMLYTPDLPDNKLVARSGSGSATAEWQGFPEHYKKQEIIRGEKKPKKMSAAVVHCFVCQREWPYGEKIPDCGKAGCRAPGSMVLAVRDES